MHKIVVYSKEGCHLCERAIQVLRELLEAGNSFHLEIVDIRHQDTLFKEYFLKIPVIQLDGKDLLSAEDVASPMECSTKLRELVLGLN